ncbi:MAG: hypothetical protein J0I88_06950 [Chryseobacterium sp.]|nr:hypothetical protein [Chryseobacterium sp.]OJX31663.1 MAG: hypothetical protein BGO86_07140 [Chryseobacterium sp. 36-9]
MDKIIKIGRDRTILISISILLFSIFSIYFEQSAKIDIDIKKLIRQIIRFILTVGLLYLVYIGKNWARILALTLFVFSIILSIAGILFIEVDLASKTPLFVVVIIYSLAIYHLAFSKSFKAFYNYQRQQMIDF